MSFTGKLKPFQVEAARFIYRRKRALLAYEMGLGKTVISIAVIERLMDRGRVSSGLVIANASLKYQWAGMLDKFTDGASYVVIDGSPKKRYELYEEAIDGYYDYIIINYEQVVNDWKMVKKLPRDFIIADEVTAIKSFTAKRSKATKQLHSKYKIGLSGQPIENMPEEGFSIMEWIDPLVLGRFDIFDRTFIKRNGWGGVQYYRNLPAFHSRLSTAMVRKNRSDPDVAPYMPKVSEETIHVEFDAKGRSLYNRIAFDLQNEIAEAMQIYGGSFNIMQHYGKAEGGKADEMRGRIMSRLTCLRMLCDSPELLRHSAKLYKQSQSGQGGSKGGSVYAYELQEKGLLDGPFPTSPKIKETAKVVEEILSASPKNKVVIFSFFKESLRLLEKELTKPNRRVVQFTGSMSAKQKEAAKKKFQTDPRTRVFLSSDAGGYGVDLPQANFLLNFDLPWSAGKLDQRNSRIIRLSTEFESVTLLNILMYGSVEVRQYDILALKRLVASAIIDGKGADKKGKVTIDLETLTGFLEASSV